MDDVQITSMKYPDNGGMTLVAKHPAFLELVAQSAKLFKEAGGVNYVEWTLGSADPEFGPFSIVIQRKNGLTPAEKLSQMKERLSQAVNSRCSCGGMGPGACGCDYCALYHFVLGNT